MLRPIFIISAAITVLNCMLDKIQLGERPKDGQALTLTQGNQEQSLREYGGGYPLKLENSPFYRAKMAVQCIFAGQQNGSRSSD